MCRLPLSYSLSVWKMRRHMVLVLGHIVTQPSKAICRYRTGGRREPGHTSYASELPTHPFPQRPILDSSTARYRKTSLGPGERLSALASGLGGLQPSRSDSGFNTRLEEEAFTTASPVLNSSSALQLKSFATPKIDTQSLKPDSGISPRLHL